MLSFSFRCSPRRLTSGLTAVALSLLGFATFGSAASAEETQAPVPIEAAAQPVPDQYIVTLRDDAPTPPPRPPTSSPTRTVARCCRSTTVPSRGSPRR